MTPAEALTDRDVDNAVQYIEFPATDLDAGKRVYSEAFSRRFAE